MKIVLITSPTGRKELPLFPLGLANLASVLYEHDVKVFDLNTYRDPFAKLDDIICLERPDAIGISLRNIDSSNSYDKYSYYPPFVKTLKRIKENDKDIITIAGGSGFSLFYQQIMTDVGEIDYGIVFEGEAAIPELLDNLKSPRSVKGVCYRDSGEIIFTGRRETLNFSELPFPKRDILDINKYTFSSDQIGVQTKRGCGFKCIYCTYPYLDGNRVRMRLPEKVVDEIEELMCLGVNKIFFSDSIFNFPHEHAASICREIIARNIKIKWRAYFNERFMDKELFDLAKESGCELFIFGTDGSSPEILTALKKDIKSDETLRVYDLFEGEDRKKLSVNYILNGPGENISTVSSLFKRIFMIISMGNVRISITNLRIYPQTELHKIALENRIIEKGSNLIYPYFYDPFPLKIISYLISLAGSFFRFLKRVRHERCFRTADVKNERCSRW